MKNIPLQLTKKWFKANLPDSKETQPLKKLIERCEAMLIGMSLPGDLKIEEVKGLLQLLGQIQAEVKKLLAKKDWDAKQAPKIKAALAGYENALKITKNYVLTIEKERAAGVKQKGISEGAISELNQALSKAEKALPELVKKLTLLTEGYGKAAPADQAKLKKAAQKLVQDAKTSVFGSKKGDWEKHWQEVRFRAAPDKLSPGDRKVIERDLVQLSQRTAKIIKTRDLILQKCKPVLS